MQAPETGCGPAATKNTVSTPPRDGTGAAPEAGSSSRMPWMTNPLAFATATTRSPGSATEICQFASSRPPLLTIRISPSKSPLPRLVTVNVTTTAVPAAAWTARRVAGALAAGLAPAAIPPVAVGAAWRGAAPFEPAAPGEAVDRAGGLADGVAVGRAGDGAAGVPGECGAMVGVARGRAGPAWGERSGTEIPASTASATVTMAATASTRPSASRRTPEAAPPGDRGRPGGLGAEPEAGPPRDRRCPGGLAASGRPRNRPVSR